MKKAITFYIDEDSGELQGAVETELFEEQSSVFRADIFNDIIGHCMNEVDTDIESFGAYLEANKGQIMNDLGMKGNS